MAQQDATSKVILGMDVRQFRKGIAQVDNSLKNISKKFNNLGGVIGATFVVSGLQRFSAEAIELNSQLSKAAAGFKRFGDESTLAEMRESTRGLVSDLELMQQSVKGANLGIPIRDMGILLEFAKRRADETGESMEHLVNSIVEGIGRKSTRRLDNLGISAQRLKEAVGGVSLEMADVADVSAAMVSIAEEELAKMGDASLTAADEITQLKVAFENFKAVAGEPIAKALRFSLDVLTEYGRSAARVARLLGKIILAPGILEGEQQQQAPDNRYMMAPSIYYDPSTQRQGGNPRQIQTLKKLTDQLADLKKEYLESEINGSEYNKALSEMIALEERINEIMTPHVDTIQLQAKGIHDLGLAYQETNGVVLQFGNLSIQLDKEAKTLNKTLESYANQLRSIMVIGQELGNVFQASFNAAMVEGLDFFDALREGLKNYVKQMAVAVASTLALATALSIIFPNIGFRAAFNVLGGGMGLPFSLDRDNKIMLGIKGADFFTGMNRNTTINNRIR